MGCGLWVVGCVNRGKLIKGVVQVEKKVGVLQRAPFGIGVWGLEVRVGGVGLRIEAWKNVLECTGSRF